MKQAYSEEHDDIFTNNNDLYDRYNDFYNNEGGRAMNEALFVFVCSLCCICVLF